MDTNNTPTPTDFDDITVLGITCPKCEQTKAPEDFHKNRRSDTGRAYHCKVCMKAASTKYYWKKKDAIANKYPPKAQATNMSPNRTPKAPPTSPTMDALEKLF